MEFKIDPRAFIDIQEQIDFYNLQQKGLGKNFIQRLRSILKPFKKILFTKFVTTIFVVYHFKYFQR